MKKELKIQIATMWEVMESLEEDASTEYLIQRVIDHFELQGIEIDASDVADAISE